MTFNLANYLLLATCLLTQLLPQALSRTTAALTLVELRRIWDAAPHNAFTDLIRFRNQWFCVFREGKGHVSSDGSLRVIVSRDGASWTSVALLSDPAADLRDPKLSISKNQRLMLNAAAALHPGAEFKHQSVAWLSRDGVVWDSPLKIGEPNLWLWRVVWHRGIAYGIGYDTIAARFIRLYSSKDGIQYRSLVPTLFENGRPNESALVFLPDKSCLCLLRREGGSSSAQFGVSRPPYLQWAWKDLGMRIGGPQLIRLPDGRLIAGGRLYEGGARMSLMWLDVSEGRLTEALKLPSGGDCSYPGMVWHKSLLWISYYSSHEGKASIYLAKVRLD